MPEQPSANDRLSAPGRGEPLAASPLWLARSGLPAYLTRKVNRTAWSVFKTVVEIDCARNARPRTIEIAPAELAELCGLDAASVMRTLEGLRRARCLALFLPEHPDEAALIEVKVPLPTPRRSEELLGEFPFNRMEPGTRLRYASALEDDEDAEIRRRGSGTERQLQRVIDLYFDSVGFKMNGFILDELRLICQRFSPEEVEKTFARARRNDIRSLPWVLRELYRISRKHDRGQ